MPTPYAQYVGDRDPVEVLRTSLEEYRALVPKFTPETWAQPWAAGKWTAGQVMLHVTQWEMIFGMRVRYGLAAPGYVVQPFNQNPLMEIEGPVADGPAAWNAFEGLRALNIALADRLSISQRATPVKHPERGDIDVADLLTTLAGHGVHHLRQLQSMTGTAPGDR